MFSTKKYPNGSLCSLTTQSVRKWPLTGGAREIAQPLVNGTAAPCVSGHPETHEQTRLATCYPSSLALRDTLVIMSPANSNALTFYINHRKEEMLSGFISLLWCHLLLFFSCQTWLNNTTLQLDNCIICPHRLQKPLFGLFVSTLSSTYETIVAQWKI